MPDSSHPADQHKPRLDKGTVLGSLCAIAGIVGGLLLEQGSIADVSQATAAIIVFGGTMGAVLVGTPFKQVVAAARASRWVLFEPPHNLSGIFEQLIAYATKARRLGILSLEEDAESIPDPFLKRAIDLAVDGLTSAELREMLELDIQAEEARTSQIAKVYEMAGGYAPTIGIIGAVLGLIQVMKNLANIEEVGHGIAVAFVATIYGVGAANLLFLPAAAKIRNHAIRRTELLELVAEGVAGITEGMNPRMLRRKLEPLTRAEGVFKAATSVESETASNTVSS